MLRAIRRERTEALVGGAEVASVFLYRLFPRLFRKFIRNHPLRRLRLRK